MNIDIHGWQLRFIVLKDSTLSYYKSAEDSDFGCRGAISLEKAIIRESEIDDCRFDISVNNLVWYLRAENPEDKRNWVDVLKSFRVSICIIFIPQMIIFHLVTLDRRRTKIKTAWKHIINTINFIDNKRMFNKTKFS